MFWRSQASYFSNCASDSKYCLRYCNWFRDNWHFTLLSPYFSPLTCLFPEKCGKMDPIEAFGGSLKACNDIFYSDVVSWKWFLFMLHFFLSNWLKPHSSSHTHQAHPFMHLHTERQFGVKCLLPECIDKWQEEAWIEHTFFKLKTDLYIYIYMYYICMRFFF